jgi:hypothetical protein
LLDEAEARIAEDPTWPGRLVQELRANPRPHTAVEAAALSLRLRRLVNLEESGIDRLAEAKSRDDAVAEAVAQTDLDLISEDIRLLDEAVGHAAAGRETGRALEARKMMLLSDYSLEGLQRKARIAKGDKPLTGDEKIRLKGIADKLKRLDRQIAQWEKRIAEAEADPAKAFTKQARKKYDRRITEREYQREQLRERFRRMERRWKRQQRHWVIKYIGRPLAEVWNFQKAWIASVDFSALRQAVMFVFGHPVQAVQKMGPGFKAFWSRYQTFKAGKEIGDRPNAVSGLYRATGMEFTTMGGELAEMEEVFLSSLAEYVPVVAGSGRAHATYLNQFRADIFDALWASLSLGGRLRPAGNPTLAEGKVIANFAMSGTGRSSLGMLKSAAVGLATVFWSPRNVISRFQLVLGQPLWTGLLKPETSLRNTYRARILIAKEYGRTLAGMAAFYGAIHLIASLWPDDDEENRPKIGYDPFSADFGKVIMGETRIDVMGGLLQATVFLFRTTFGQTTTQKGKTKALRNSWTPLTDKEREYRQAGEGGIALKLTRSKLGPSPGAIMDVLSRPADAPPDVIGEDFKGDPVTVGDMAYKMTVPMSPDDIVDAMTNQGVPKSIALAIVAFFGSNVQTHKKRPR